MYKIAVIIVNWNGKKYLKDCFDSLEAQTEKNFKVIFVDNGSEDDSVDFIKANYLEAELPSKIFAEKFIPWPDFAFYLKVDPEKIMRRERKPDQGLEYLAAKEKIYAQRIEDWDMMVLDGEKDKEEIFESIISKIKD